MNLHKKRGHQKRRPPFKYYVQKKIYSAKNGYL